jgi:hypothetical protein
MKLPAGTIFSAVKQPVFKKKFTKHPATGIVAGKEPAGTENPSPENTFCHEG